MEYLQIQNKDKLPDISIYRPFKCVVVIEQEVDPEWQANVSKWLCDSGCLYMMAWGNSCSSWDDSVDLANILQFEGKEIPVEFNVYTTWHKDEPISEVFWFAKYTAYHESHELKHTIILHISPDNKYQEFSAKYDNA